MSSRRRAARLVTLLALAVASFAGAGVAEAKTVTATAAGGVVPNATRISSTSPTTFGVFVQTFSLKGGKVKKKQVLDVNLTLNGTGSGPEAANDLTFSLFAPSGDVFSFTPPDVQSFTNVILDDQSQLSFCNPFELVSDDCNYLIGITPGLDGSGLATGTVHALLNQHFRGLSPKGDWTLRIYDGDPNPGGAPLTTVVGTSTIEVKTGKRFAKS